MRAAEDRARPVQTPHRSDTMVQYTLYRCQILTDTDEIPPDRIQGRILPGNWRGFRSSHTASHCDHGLHHLQDGSAGPKFR